MDGDERIISEIMKLGCKTKKEAAILLQVYHELHEVRKYSDVNYFFDSKSEKMYLTAKTEKSENSIFLPVPTSDKIHLSEIQNFINSENINTSSVCLVMIAGDSSKVFYEVSKGLVLPLNE